MSIESNNIKALIDANVKQNGNNEITGQILNSVLTAMNTASLKGYHFQGILSADTTLPNNSPYFYIVVGPLSYNAWTWIDGEIGFLAYSNNTGDTPQRGTIARIDLLIGEHNDDPTAHQFILDEIDEINDMIPAQASPTNKLADKDFVNSSINSSAAFFRGTYADQLALLAVAWQTTDPDAQYYVSNNDYAYVEEIVSGSAIGNWNPADHLGEAWRFIYVEGSGWEPQFKVNDTPFTAAQLAAINSGITATLVGEITTLGNTKADKVTGATSGDLAGLDASGNLTDSGIAANKVMQKVTGATAGDVATLNASGEVVDSGVQLSSLARDNEVVHLTQEETVSGVKNFSNGLQVSSQLLWYDTTNQCMRITFN